MKKILITAFALAMPVLASAQVQLMSGYNFGQFLIVGNGAVDGDTFADSGSIGSNWTALSSPPLESAGDYVFGNGLSGNYSDGSGRVFWDGTAGSSSLTGLGTVASTDIGNNAINAFAVDGTNIALLGDWGGGAGIALKVGSAASIGFVQNTLSFGDYAGGPAANLTFSAAAVSSPISINWIFGGNTVATSIVSSTAQSVFSVDLPDSFYGLNAAELTASFSGAGIIDNVQFNGQLAAIPEPSTYALILGALTLGFVAFRRRMNAAVVA